MLLYLLCYCTAVDVSDGFNLTQMGEHQFQFLDVVTSSIALDDATPTPHVAVTGAAHHYYAQLPPPPPPQPMYVIIDHGIYPTSAAVVGPAATPVAPLMTPQMQSAAAGVVLPPGVIPAAAAPTLLRPSLIQQPQRPTVIMPAPSGILPPTSIIASHGAVRPLPHSAAVGELALSASAGYSGQPLIAGANRFDNLPYSSVPVDVHAGARLAQHDGVYIGSGGCNVNNSAAERPHCDTEHPVVMEQSAAELERDDQTHALSPCAEHTLDDVVVSGNGLVACEERPASDGGAELHEAPAGTDSQPELAAVNGELSVDASSHDFGSLSETSSVTSPNSLVADVTLNDSDRDGCVVTKDHSPICMQQTALPSASVTSPSTAVKTKATWASLLKDTTSATNAIVICMNDSHAAALQQKTDVKAVTKEPVAPQSAISSHVSTDRKLKLEISGLCSTALSSCLQCFEAVGRAAGRASGL